MKTLLGLQKPLGGTLRFGEGFDRRQIGYLPQQTVVQRDFPAVVEEIVLSGCLNRIGRRIFFGAAEKARARHAMDTLGIRGLRRRSYRELSGGQQQRVLLARALCAADSTLLLDEPVTGLDPEATADLYGIIGSLHERGMTILMITHDIDSVRFATRVLHLGRRFFFGTAEEFARTGLGGGE
jgi:zinc transport system ATP-binding protein